MTLVKQLRDERGRERLIRRFLRLPAKRPEAPGWTPNEREKIRRRRAAWHAEDRRADIAHAVAYAPIIVRQLKDRALREIEFARGKRALASARTLRYTSIAIHPIRGCPDIEGYFAFKGRSSLGVWLVATGSVSRWALGSWTDGEVFDTVGDRYVLIPGDEVTPEKAAEALRRWYRRRFEFKRHHWTHLTGSEPTIVLDLKWFDGDEGPGVLS